MLPVAALPPLLRFLDGIDSSVARKLMRKVPWDESAITRELCDLLDEDYSEEYSLSYSLEQLRRDLGLAMPLVSVDFTIETHQYSAQVENWVTQSDIGMVLKYQDRFVPTESWTSSLLLQAKRLFPQARGVHYSEASRFDSFDSKQHSRIRNLNELLECDLVSYLLYCPRPSSLDKLTAAKLAHLRNLSVNGEIFDFARGLALHRELEAGGQTLAAGVFVAKVDAMPKTLAQIHGGIFKSTIPLSWLLTLEFADAKRFVDLPSGMPFGVNHAHLDSKRSRIVDGILAGDEAVTQAIGALAGRNVNFAPLRVLPRHTISISISAGGQADPDQQLVINQ
ncbi:hypothetical protein [Micromonospora sp. U21]|uniref:hypothetical protein n=1 Tax=Micromonospora sp. U21 TaxID=2824899 RepID=UPI001B35AD85|nr:hypothetical protein [Micromonospora sp. U21]MBQ0906348.1 hypothetical protein [Micromonospora sp. U21]